MDVSIIFVSYNTSELTKKAIALAKQSVSQFSIEMFVIDNASKDDSVEMIKREFPEVHLIANTNNVGFGRANNQAIPYVKGRYVLLLNTDAFVEADTIQKTVEYMEHNPKTGILGVKLLGRDGSLQPSCRYFPTPMNSFLVRTGLHKVFSTVRLVDDMTWDHDQIRDCDWVPGCYYLVRKEVIDQVGLFDPRFFLYSEEVDHCFSAKKAGWKVTYFSPVSVVHIGGESAKVDNKISSVSRQVSALQIESELLYFRKNLGLIGAVSHLFLTIASESILFLKRFIKHPLNVKEVFNFKGLFMYLKIAYLNRLGQRPLR